MGNNRRDEATDDPVQHATIDLMDSSEVKRRLHSNSPAFLVIIVGVLLLFVILVGWVIVANDHRPDFNQNIQSPDIDLVEEINEDPSWELRGSITDLLLKYPIEQAEHPLDPALLIAKAGLKHLKESVIDYTATVSKQERVNGKLLEPEFFECKIRHQRLIDGVAIPKSFYLKFVKPKQIAGREVIWVEGRNRDRLVAHEAGILGLVRVNLNPTDRLAMMGNRYPITELGMETLIARMIEKGERARQFGNCEVTYDRTLEINGRKGTLITITHPKKSDEFEFFQAKIYIDDEHNLPVGYQGYLWPESEDGAPLLLESYFYSDIQVNVGLTDLDFDPDNPAYKFP